MLSASDIRTLPIIFSDAHLVDIDCSRWDTAIGVYVIADHLPQPSPTTRSLVAVRFLGVERFEWAFQHHHFSEFPLKDNDPTQHLIWNIYVVEINTLADKHVIALSGGKQFPRLTLAFEDVQIDYVPHAVFADVNPQWSNLSLGMGRPGIEDLRKLFRRAKKR
jgi:hypothetical protein